MKLLFFLFDISPEAGILSILIFLMVFLCFFIKGTGKKGYEKKDSHDWKPKDWKEYQEDVQKRLDELSDK